MEKETPVKEWPDITNGVISFLGKFIALPLLVLGSLVCLCWNPFIGMLLIFGAAMIIVLATLLLLLFKPLLEKKYPIQSRKLRPVSILVDIPGEAPREESVMTTGNYQVPTDMLREDMTPLQKLAVDRCSSDLEAALLYLFTYMSEEDQNAYTENATPLETEAHMSIVSAHTNEIPPEKLDQIVEQAYYLTLLDMSEEEVLSTEKNPFAPKLWRCLGGLLLASVVVGVIAGLGHRFIQNESLIAPIVAALGCGTTIFAYKVVEVLINYIRFRKAKRLLLKYPLKK